MTVIVVNWNGRRYLESCLSSILAQTYRNLEVVLVDNGSTDRSVEFVAERFPEVRVLVNQENVGFAAANNQAIEVTRGEYVALLNNDTYADPAWLERLVAAMEVNPRVGACASKMLLAEEQEIIDSAGIELNVVGIAWGRMGGQREQQGPVDSPVEVFGASGGAAQPLNCR
ncbi:MAG: glycosyltransferase family 2 protein, partial [Candidatus Marsarchaeota archaeon]|nr:glycosyltransferase family 2 protein [Candidatus Marsarchaeota archaeon]